jgi:transposase
MARSLSVDLRRRVVDAIEGGLSWRAAAQRFGVSASSAIRWRAQERREGDVRPKRQGGDRHSQRIEAHAELILSAVATKNDITLAELRERLKERGVPVAIGTLWRFFKRRKITRNRGGEQLQMARRDVDDQPSHAPVAHRLQLGRQHLDAPARPERPLAEGKLQAESTRTLEGPVYLAARG